MTKYLSRYNTVKQKKYWKFEKNGSLQSKILHKSLVSNLTNKIHTDRA